MTEQGTTYPNIREKDGTFTTTLMWGYDSGGPTTEQHNDIAQILRTDPRGLGDRFNTLRISPKGDEVIITGSDKEALDMTAFAYAQLPGVLNFNHTFQRHGGWTSHASAMTFTAP